MSGTQVDARLQGDQIERRRRLVSARRDPATDHSRGAASPSSPGDAEWDEVEIRALRPGSSPRLTGEDEEHVLALAGVESPLPPVLVHRATMTVVDGMHRLRAAALRGEETVRVRYFDGTLDEAFVEAVRANVCHGKPLTLAEREVAAERILRSQPHWSDRTIADWCGLSARTIAALRNSIGDEVQSAVRLGRDGRARPVDTDQARERAADLFRRDPDASLRKVASEVGIAPATARDVKMRMRKGIGPRLRSPEAQVTERRAAAPLDKDGVFNDSALRSTESNCAFLGWMESHIVEIDDWKPYVDDVPRSRVYALADVARRCANVWQALANALEDRSKGRR